ncbi:type II secretion system protein [Lentzea tibetensis]|uniref:Type II secretion system protein n=1 Tax=Lentzea tibetensis TaxID=2591470 RepID=A0A563EVM8_9PSEU|nr:type II secretion system protein [Lentzea tibetensis]
MSAILAAAALLVWPNRAPVDRLRKRPQRANLVVPQVFLVPLAAATAWWLAGVGALTAGTLLTLTTIRVAKTRAKQRNRLTATESLTTGLAAVVDELRAGAHAAGAAESAAQDCPEPARQVFKAIAATARLGGDVHNTLTAMAADHPQLHTALPQLARAWHVSTDLGVPLAEALDAVRDDLTQRTAFAKQTDAKLAGPRASAAVLAALPVFGLLLGQLSGAHPLHVLTATTPGQVLLVLGALLTCTGLLWTTHITSQAVLP